MAALMWSHEFDFRNLPHARSMVARWQFGCRKAVPPLRKRQVTEKRFRDLFNIFCDSDAQRRGQILRPIIPCCEGWLGIHFSGTKAQAKRTRPAFPAGPSVPKTGGANCLCLGLSRSVNPQQFQVGVLKKETAIRCALPGVHIRWPLCQPKLDQLIRGWCSRRCADENVIEFARHPATFCRGTIGLKPPPPLTLAKQRASSVSRIIPQAKQPAACWRCRDSGQGKQG